MLPVALDARRLQERPLGGVGRWLANLLPHLADQVDLVLLTDGRRPPVSVAGSGALPQVALWLPPRLPEVAWIQASAPWWLRGFGGVFHGTFNSLPALWRGPSVVTIHDLASLHHTEDFGRARVKRAVWTAQLARAVRQARVIQTDSGFIRDAVVATYRVDPARVVVASPAVDPVFSPLAAEQGRQLARELGVTAERYIVAIGGARRRGLAVAIEAWAEARRGGVVADLVVVGRERPSSARPGQVYAGSQPDQAWAALLAGAAALCYPTRYEGFGMPALEAAASGVPVVCARTGPLPEILDGAAEWCDEASVGPIAAGLERVLSDPDRWAELRRAGLAQVAAGPTWSQSAQVLADAYQLAAS